MFFGNFIFNRVISGPGFGFFDKIRTWPGSALGFFFLKTHTRPYSLSDRVKSSPLGSGRTEYPRIRFKWPSLLWSNLTDLWCPIQALLLEFLILGFALALPFDDWWIGGRVFVLGFWLVGFFFFFFFENMFGLGRLDI